MSRLRYHLLILCSVFLLAVAPTVSHAQETAESTAEPTLEPTVEVTPEATVEPTLDPTLQPTVEPTSEPTLEPTIEATPEATVEPTAEPTLEPTVDSPVETTVEPTIEATAEITPTLIMQDPGLPLVAYDSFDSGDLSAWINSTFVPVNGHVELSIDSALMQRLGDSLFDTTTEARFQIGTGGMAQVALRRSQVGFYSITLDSNGQVNLYRGANILWHTASTLPAVPGTWRALRLSAVANQVQVWVDGVELLSVTDDTPLPSGAVLIGGSAPLQVDDFTVWGVMDAPAQPTEVEIIPVEIAIIRAAEQVMLATLPGTSLSSIIIEPSNLRIADNWAIGTAAVSASDDHASPLWTIFLARFDGQAWRVEISGTPTFASWLQQLPDSVIGADAKALLLSNLQASSSSLASTSAPDLSLPFPVGQSYPMSGGPHSDHGAGDTTGVWNSIDFSGGWNLPIVAADAGLVIRPCGNLVVIFHSNGWQTGYYHLENIGVASWTNYGRGQLIGGTGMGLGCGGGATGPHVHFTLWRDMPVAAAYPSMNYAAGWNGREIGGWRVEAGGSQYSGSMVRIRDGARAYVNGGVYNEGCIASCIPGTPVITAPANGSSGFSPFNIVVQPGLIRNINNSYDFHVQIDNNANFSSPEYDNGAAWATSTTIPVNMPPGVWYIRVRQGDRVSTAGNWSAATTFTAIPPTCPPPRPVLSAPASGIVTYDSTPTLSWTAPANTPGVSYRVQIDDNSNFSSPVHTAQNITATSYAIPGSLLTNRRYYWRVQAYYTSTCQSSWTSGRYFTVNTNAPTLRAPANNAVVRAARTPFSWAGISGAANYHLQVDDNADFSSLILNRVQTGTSYTLPTALAQGRYYWRVRWQDRLGNWSAFSSVFSFALSIQNAPADGLISTNTRPTFSWYTYTGATRYQVQVDNNSNFSSPEMSYSTANAAPRSYRLPAALGFGTYYWRVNVDVGSGFVASPFYRRITLTPVAPPATRITSPTCGSTTNDPNPYIAWNPVNYPHTAVTYQVQIDTTSSFAAPLTYGVTLSSTGVIVPFDLVNGWQYVRVRAANSYGSTSAWSSASCRFRVNFTPPTAPVLTSPVSGLSSRDTTSMPVLRWNAVSGASGYEVQMDDDPNFGSVSWTASGIASTSIQPPALGAGRYYWRVRALTALGGKGYWSVSRYQFRYHVTYRARMYWSVNNSGCVSSTQYDEYYFEIWNPARYVWFPIYTGAVRTAPENNSSGNARWYNPLPQGQGYYVTVYPATHTLSCVNYTFGIDSNYEAD